MYIKKNMKMKIEEERLKEGRNVRKIIQYLFEQLKAYCMRLKNEKKKESSLKCVEQKMKKKKTTR